MTFTLKVAICEVIRDILGGKIMSTEPNLDCGPPKVPSSWGKFLW